jgi:hypothetical protein
MADRIDFGETALFTSSSCSEANCHPEGGSPANRGSRVTDVVLSSDGEGDRAVESLA